MKIQRTWLSLSLLVLVSHTSLATELPIPPSKAEEAGLQCAPLKVNSNDVLHIVLPPSRGSDFAVVNPNGDYLFISFYQPDSHSPLQPVIPPSVFSGLKEIALGISSAKGVSTTRAATEKIFDKPGKYKVLVSPTLETEDPVIDGWCEISFRK
jgi:hypothetical protein